MRCLLVGGSGQLGRELRDTCPSQIELHAPTRGELDLTDRSSLEEWLEAAGPDVVVNAAAYTAVDLAEEESEAASRANSEGPRLLADCLRVRTGRLIHISTDFVFDGGKEAPYQPSDAVNPLGVYGASKLAGERAVQELLPDRSLIVRTSWLYSTYGNNFVKTMLRLIAEREEVRVVSDQTGSPTWARGLAHAVWRWAQLPQAVGVRHWADWGTASWFDLAVAVGEEGEKQGILSSPGLVLPIATAEYPTAARRPPMSALDSSLSWSELELRPQSWRDALADMLSEHKERSDE